MQFISSNFETKEVDDPDTKFMSTSIPYLDSVSSDAYATSYSSNSSSSRAHTTGPAFESAVASYASRVLKKKSPPESFVDSSVGPYVASMLRSSLKADELPTDFTTGLFIVESLTNYDALMELLEEHCSMSEEVAKSALRSIAKALVTGVFEDDENRSVYGSIGSSNSNGFPANNGFYGGQKGKYRSLSLGAENDYVGGKFRSLSLGNKDDADQIRVNSSSLYGELFGNFDFEQNIGSMHQLGEATKIEEEPSFLFEEDELPEELDNRHGNNFSEEFSFLNSRTEEKMNEKGLPHSNPTKGLPQSITPLKPDRLIPLDLLGFKDDCSLTIVKQNSLSLSDKEEVQSPAHVTPPSSELEIPPKEKNTSTKSEESSNPEELPTRNGNKKKKTKRKDMDLAASLFARPRSRSIHDVTEKSPKLKPMVPPPNASMGLPALNNASASAMLNNSIPALYQKQLDSCVQILMAMNYDICEEAAYEAAAVSNANVNLAQHVIDGVLSAPPVCRHMLNDGCYRSDCQFSHDVEGHTCLFWLKGRCGKGENCKFLHGFSEKLLEGVDIDFLKASEMQNDYMSTQTSTLAANSIKTANLVQHNLMAPFTLPASAANTNSHAPPSNQCSFVSESSQPISNQEQNQMEPVVLSQSAPGSTSSFAKIATKGYSEKSSFGPNIATSTSNATSKKCNIVRIPQNLWNPLYNRSSHSFHISDPLARYREVSATTLREDVIDLHFQSIKTFPIVLSTVLPEKLRDHQQVWIVTGSGHHVNTSSHQKGGGVLENAVIGWLLSNEYNFMKGRDKNGFGGACLVKGRNR